MPRHKQVTTCRKSDGPVSKHCSCEHCTLSVCEVCGAGEGTLTSACPGTRVNADKQQEVLETNLDYSDECGWHLLSTARRSPRFENAKVPPEPEHVDPRTLAAPSTDWAKVDRAMDLQHVLFLKSIAWALADRIADDHSAACTRLEDEVDEAQLPATLRSGLAPNAAERELLNRLESAKIAVQLACRDVERCDLEWQQMARRSLAVLEQDPVPPVLTVPLTDPLTIR